MVFTLLGNNPVNFGDGWVLYDPISLVAGRTYLMEIAMTTGDPEGLYSYWKIRYAFPTTLSALAAPLDEKQLFFEPLQQYFQFTIPTLAAPTGNCQFACRRFPFYSQPGTLADMTIAMGLDPDLFL